MIFIINLYLQHSCNSITSSSDSNEIILSGKKKTKTFFFGIKISTVSSMIMIWSTYHFPRRNKITHLPINPNIVINFLSATLILSLFSQRSGEEMGSACLVGTR